MPGRPARKWTRQRVCVCVTQAALIHCGGHWASSCSCRARGCRSCAEALARLGFRRRRRRRSEGKKAGLRRRKEAVKEFWRRGLAWWGDLWGGGGLVLQCSVPRRWGERDIESKREREGGRRVQNIPLSCFQIQESCRGCKSFVSG